MIDSLLGLTPQAASGWVSKPASDDYWYSPRGADTVSGANINEDVALTITTVFACVSKLSKTLASLPVDVVEKTGRIRKSTDHPLEELLSGAANEEASGLTVRETIQANLELWGNAFVAVDWDYRGQEPRRLTPLPSREVTVKRNDDGELVYVWRPEGGSLDVIPADRMWHIPGLSLNGITGLSAVGYNRETLGLTVATNQFGGAFFGNGAWAGGFFSRPPEAPPLSSDAGNKFLAEVNEKFRGAEKAFGFGLLREGTEFKQIDIPMEDAMFLTTRKFQRVEICGMFDVPPTMIQDYEHSNYKNSEQAALDFQQMGLLPRIVRLEMAARRRFFRGTKLQLKFNLAGFVRADFKTRLEGYAIGRNWGMYSANDCRAMEDLNPIEGGDEYLTPLNMTPLGQPRPTTRDSEEARITVSPTVTLGPSIEHAADLIMIRQCKALASAVERYAPDKADGFVGWAEKFFASHRKVVVGELTPLYRACGIDEPADKLADELCADWQLLTTTAGLEGAAALNDEWEATGAAALVSRLRENLGGSE